jgi:hypothetical protein
MLRSRFLPVSAPALGCALLWGLIECVALWRSRWTARRNTVRG